MKTHAKICTIEAKVSRWVSAYVSLYGADRLTPQLMQRCIYGGRNLLRTRGAPAARDFIEAQIYSASKWHRMDQNGGQ